MLFVSVQFGAILDMADKDGLGLGTKLEIDIIGYEYFIIVKSKSVKLKSVI